MSRFTDFIDKVFYREYCENWDDMIFRRKICATVPEGSCVLDLGAGAGIVAEMNFKGYFQKISGIDLDPRVVYNPYIDEGKIADCGAIPYSDASFDAVYADNVVEHLVQPDLVFSEVFRVLKPGGVFLFKTPNRFHYMPLIARFTPVAFHKFVNKIRGRAAEDTFPTLYRANCSSDVFRISKGAGFDGVSIDLIEGRPEYLRMFFLTYIVGLFYERFVNSLSAFSSLRILMIVTLTKPS